MTPRLTAIATVFLIATTPMALANKLNPIPQGPINCATAEGDIRALNAEKDYAQKQQAASVIAVTPAGALFGLATGTEQTRLEVLSGDYEKMIDARVNAIQAKCKAK